MKLINKINDIYYGLGKNRWLIPFVLIFPFMKISYFRTIMIMTPIYDVFRWIFAGLLIIYALINKTKINKLMIVAFIMMIWTIINITIQNPSVLWDTIKDCLSILSIYLIIEIFINDKKSLLKGFILNFEIAIYLELILYIIFPNGINTELVHFLGLATVLSLYLFPAMSICVLYYKEFNNKIRCGLLLIGCLLCTIIIPCATTKLAVLGVIGVLILGLLLKKYNIAIKLWPLVLATIGINIFLIFIYSSGNFSQIDRLFIVLFHKRATFSGRSPIWQTTVEYIKQKPFSGYGFGSVVDVPVEGGMFRAHNEWLQRMLSDGILGFLSFACFNYVFIKKIDNMKNDFYRVSFVGISFAMYITYCMEAYTNVYLYYFILFLAYDYDNFCEKETKNILLK